jgi:2-keto-4-pentenoate hydratase/2-oxohepta-3-ene-1,7-dioic acid hydratase in catechol pathway
MKLASYLLDGAPRFGLVLGDGLHDLTEPLRGRAEGVDAVLRLNLLDELHRIAGKARVDLAFSDVHFLPPVVRPGKIVCVGINYRTRPGEYQRSEPPAYPSLFFRTPAAQVGHLEPLRRPPESTQFDYEGEIALVIGRPGRRIAEAKALSHVAGYACFNEGSVRDWMRHGVYNVTAGKNFDASGAFGPWLATADEVRDPHDMTLRTRVNGELVQEDSTANLIFPFEKLIAYVSTFSRLEVGDVIVTGTPTGAGAKRTPPRWLAPGDVVEVEVPEIGTLRNAVADESA